MSEILKVILDWSEVWALLLPIGVLAYTKQKNDNLKPVVYFVLISFFLYFLIDFSWKFKEKLQLPQLLHDNRFLYNISCLIRTFCFLAFFTRQGLPFKGRWPWFFPILFLLIAIVNFTFFESFNLFSNYLHLAESIILLIYCLSYYLRILTSDLTDVFSTPQFWITTGLTLYEAVNLPIFMNYNNLSDAMTTFAVDLWSVHNIVFIILCTFISRGLYLHARR